MKNNSKNQLTKEYTSMFYRGNRLAFFGWLTASLMLVGVNFMLSWLLQQFIDSISGVVGSKGLLELGMVALSVIALVVISKLINHIAYPKFIMKAMRQYKELAFSKLMQKGIASFGEESTATYISALSNDATVIEEKYLDSTMDLITNVTLTVGAIAMMLIYDPLLTVIACGLFIPSAAVALFAGKRLESVQLKVSESNSKFIAMLKDCLTGFGVIKSFKAEGAISRLFDKSNRDVEQAMCERRKTVNIIGLLTSCSSVIAQFGVFLAGGLLIISGRGLTAGMLMVFINLVGIAITPIGELPSIISSRKSAAALIEKLSNELECNSGDDGDIVISSPIKSIKFNDVSFSYDEGKTVLHNISTSLDAGKSYCIVGASGSGKSTFLNLTTAGHRNYSGDIRINGIELRQINSDSLYDNMSVIQQNVFVFDATVRENITMFGDYESQRVDKAIEKSGLKAFIDKHGEDYMCGENGSNLSGGEKQRIAIARSLIKKSSVLLADEATAALDAETVHHVLGSILSLDNMTRVVVTHSMDKKLLKRYDCILVMKDGRLTEHGTFDELISHGGYFSSLYAISN